MIERTFAISLTLLAALGAVNVLPACGDKFLISSRGTRYQRAPAARVPAAILIYTNPASEAGKVLAGIPVDAALRKVGYRPTIVETQADFEKALSRGGWDLLLVGLADARAVSQRVKNNIGLLPVVAELPPAAVKETARLYPVVLRAPAKSQTLVEAVDEALAMRPKGQSKPAKADI